MFTSGSVTVFHFGAVPRWARARLPAVVASVTQPDVSGGRRLSSWAAWLTLALGLLSLAAVGLLELRIDRVGKPAFRFLIWNLGLAWIPFVLSLGVAAVHGQGRRRPLLWALGLSWLLFLPNAPYVITDFVHLSVRSARRCGSTPCSSAPSPPRVSPSDWCPCSSCTTSSRLALGASSAGRSP